MKLGDTVIYQVNPNVQRVAKVVHEYKKTDEKTKSVQDCVDIMVYTHPDDYPEFSQEECRVGSAIRRDVKEGLNPGDYFYKPAAAAPAV